MTRALAAWILLFLTLAACTPEPDPLVEDDTGDPTKPLPPGKPGVDTGKPGVDTGDTGDTGDPQDTGEPWVAPEPGAPIEPPPYLSGAGVAGLTDAIDDVVDDTSSDIGLHIIDLENDQIVYTRDADGWFKPASNTKLFTTAVALDHLGADHRPTVRAYAAAAPSAGRLTGDLRIVGQHDGSWSDWLQHDPEVPARRLAVALRRAGVSRVTGDLVVAGDFVFDPYRFGYLDPDAMREDASEVLWTALSDEGITVDGTLRLLDDPEPPAGQRLLATWRGRSLEATTAIINRISHNELSDLLARHTGFLLEGRNSYDGNEVVVAAWLADAGLPTDGLNLDDGSGLSHSNRVSPELVAGLYAYQQTLPSVGPWMRSLSIAGYNGTLAGRMSGPSTRGRFWGKTGTLNGVIATGGILHHPEDGHRYAVSILANSVANSAVERVLHDRIVERLARDWRGGGVRPADPIARSLRVDGDRLRLSWAGGEGGEGVEVWRSEDGRVWLPEDATWHEATEVELPIDGGGYVRLIAVGEGGRSEPSDVLVARAGRPRVLLVDGNDRWDVQDVENPLGQGHDFLARVAQGLPGLAIDSVANEVVEEGQVVLSDYDLVVYVLGEESTEDESFSAEEQTRVRAYVEGGGALVVSGAEVAWDLDHRGDAADQAFASEVLGGRYLADDAGTWLVEPAEATFVDLGDAGFHLPGYLVASYPDVLTPGPRSRVALAYVSGGAAAIRREDAPVLWLGFPVELVDDVADRETILLGAVRALGVR